MALPELQVERVRQGLQGSKPQELSAEALPAQMRSGPAKRKRAIERRTG
jgi:hypothetical protein